MILDRQGRIRIRIFFIEGTAVKKDGESNILCETPGWCQQEKVPA